MFRSLVLGLLLISPGNALAGPVNFKDSTPRWIAVAFEVSPRNEPARVASVFTPKVRAWMEPASEPGLVRVTVDASSVEHSLMGDDEAVPGSFSEFVWILDPDTGEVHSAELSGEVMVELDWGLFRSKVKAQIEVAMGTDRLGGFSQPRHWLGQEIFSFCETPKSRSCTLVHAVPYEESSGYVNAVGELSVQFGDLSMKTFSPLGEAIFSEAAPTALIGATWPASHGDAALPVVENATARAAQWVALPAVSAGPLQTN